MAMKSLLLCCLICASIAPSIYVKAMTAEQKEKVREHFEKIGMECIKDIPISEDDIAALRAKKIPTGANVPCFMACMLRHIGGMDDKGMLSKEKGLDLAKQVFNDDEEVKRIEQYMDSCLHINNEAVSDGEKGCDRAIMALKCMHENASQFGFDI